MFLKSLPARNRRFLEAAVALHQAGAVPANACLLDLDAMAAGQHRAFRRRRHGLR